MISYARERAQDRIAGLATQRLDAVTFWREATEPWRAPCRTTLPVLVDARPGVAAHDEPLQPRRLFNDVSSRAQCRFPRPVLEAQLSYVQAVQAEAVRAAHLAQRMFLWKSLITAATLALAAGVISTDQEVELTGLHFRLDLWALLVAGSVLAFLMLVLDFAQYERAHRLGWRAAELYARIGYLVPKQDLLTPNSPLGMPHVAVFPHEAIWGRWVTYRSLAARLWGLAWAVLVSTQALVAWRLGSDFGWTPLVLLFCLLPLATLAVGVSRLYYTRKEALEGKRPWHERPSQPESPTSGVSTPTEHGRV